MSTIPISKKSLWLYKITPAKKYSFMMSISMFSLLTTKMSKINNTFQADSCSIYAIVLFNIFNKASTRMTISIIIRYRRSSISWINLTRWIIPYIDFSIRMAVERMSKLSIGMISEKRMYLITIISPR